jgi:hypothetical protein
MISKKFLIETCSSWFMFYRWPIIILFWLLSAQSHNNKQIVCHLWSQSVQVYHHHLCPRMLIDVMYHVVDCISPILWFCVVLDMTPCSCSQSLWVFWFWGSKLLISTTCMTGSQQPRVVPPISTMCWSLTFTFLTGNVCWARTGVHTASL